MSNEKIKIVKELYIECLESRELENARLQNNLNRVSEIDAFLKSIEDSEEYDYKVFSPRKVEDIYRHEIDFHKEELLNIEKDNQYHYKRIAQFDRQIKKFDLLLADSTKSEKINTADNYSLEIEKQRSINNVKLKNLKVLDIQEKERQRIASELHDSSLQNLTHLVHSIELSSMYIDKDLIQAKLELASCIKNLRQIINDIRETIFNLRPMSFDDLGFKQCIENFLNSLKSQYKECEIECKIEDIEFFNIQDKENQNLLFITIYRIIQEAMINSLKHSGAELINLNINILDNNCFIDILDNGKGFDVENAVSNRNKHFGMKIMKERIDLINGTLKINSTVGTGTQIKVVIPLL